MKLSLYTIVKDGLYNDLHVVAMLRHHLPLFDEILVNDGNSTDGTYEAVSSIDPRIKVFRSEWTAGDRPGALFANAKNAARERCTGDWCILLDCDEFIPEWEFDRIREELPRVRKPIVPLRFVQFYGNYLVHHAAPPKIAWPLYKYPVHPNRPDMVVVHDGANVVVRGQEIRLPQREPAVADRDPAVEWDVQFACHHMGQIRNPSRLRQKWRVQTKLKQEKPKLDRTPGFVFDLAPHDWFDKDFIDDLRIYDGPQVAAVRDDPAEFVRDDMKLYEFLCQRDGRPGVAVPSA